MPRQSLAPKVFAGTVLPCSRAAARASARVLFVALALLTYARPVGAQFNNGLPTGSYPSYPATNTQVFKDDLTKVINRTGPLYINRQDCPSDAKSSSDSALIEIDVANLNRAMGSVQVLEVWRGQSTSGNSWTQNPSGGQNCFAASARQNTTAVGGSSAVTQCTKMKFSPNSPTADLTDSLTSVNLQNQKIFIRAVDAFTTVPPNSGTTTFKAINNTTTKCDLSAGYSLFVIPLTQPTTSSPGATPAPGIPMPTPYEVFEIKFYIKTTPLDAPGSVTGGSGNTQVKVKWKAPNGANQQTKYDIIYDTSALAPSDGSTSCSSDLLKAGKIVPRDADIKSKGAGSTTSATIDPAELGLSLNEQVPAVVVSEDAAGNFSNASNLICIKRVQTTGFWGECQQESGCPQSFSKCSISHPGRDHAWGWSLSLIGLALWLRRSKRAGRRASEVGRTV